MKSPIHLASLLGALSMLCACGTLTDQEVNGVLLEMKANEAQVIYEPPAHCSPPGYRAVFHPGAGVVMTVMHGFGGGLAARFRIELDSGSTFAFGSASGRVFFPTGAPQKDVFISNTSWIRDSRTVRAVASADAVLTGRAPAGDRSVYEGDISAYQVTANDFSLQLPDAVVNGNPFRFPPIHFSGRQFRYVQEACLR